MYGPPWDSPRALASSSRVALGRSPKMLAEQKGQSHSLCVLPQEPPLGAARVPQRGPQDTSEAGAREKPRGTRLKGAAEDPMEQNIRELQPWTQTGTRGCARDLVSVQGEANSL